MTTPGQRRSRKQERAGAAQFGGRVNPGSGNGWVHKNDVRTASHSIEYKTTANASFTLKLTDLKTAEHHAAAASSEMAFIIDIQGREYAVITKDHFLELLDGDG